MIGSSYLSVIICLNRQKDLELFLEQTRSKFVGLQVKNDLSSLAGLPQPIHVAVKVLKEVGLYARSLKRYRFNDDVFVSCDE